MISADSRQIFKYMDIGTDKVPLETRNKIPHHLIDIITPEQTYTAGQRKDDTTKIINEIHQRNKLPIVV
ncbi:TPA: hypothetical protein DEP21_05115 [Patescibacteria group bacterium]|nr:hypothetical protein [Candidatus Gracilibacteria bacterium]